MPTKNLPAESDQTFNVGGISQLLLRTLINNTHTIFVYSTAPIVPVMMTLCAVLVEQRTSLALSAFVYSIHSVRVEKKLNFAVSDSGV
jgi:hypothetical protein